MSRILAKNSVNLIKVIDGVDGENPVLATLSNYSVVIPSNVEGNAITYENTSVFISVKSGEDDLEPILEGDLDNYQFKLKDKTLEGIEKVGDESLDNGSIKTGLIEKMSTDTGRIIFNLEYKINDKIGEVSLVLIATKAKQGLAGDNGSSSFTSIRYSEEVYNGTENWYPTTATLQPSVNSYSIGIYTGFIDYDSPGNNWEDNLDKYKWSTYGSAKVKDIKTTFLATATDERPSVENDWSSDIPSSFGEQYKYLWKKDVYFYYGTNNSNSVISLSGTYGEKGEGLEEINFKYKLTNSSEQPTEGWRHPSWSTTVPEPTDEQKYLWRITEYFYSDGSSKYTYDLISVKGEKGADGVIHYSDNPPANPTIGMQWMNTGSTPGYIKNTLYVWDGTGWNILEFSADNIKTGVLSALQANFDDAQVAKKLIIGNTGGQRIELINNNGVASIEIYKSDGQTKSFYVGSDGELNFEGNIKLSSTGKTVEEQISQEIQDIEIANVNLMKNSQGPFKPDRENIDNYKEYPETTVHLENGKTYILTAKSNGTFTNSHTGTSESNNVTLWLVGDNFWQIISDEKTGSKEGTVLKWNFRTGDFRLRVNVYHPASTNEIYVEEIQIAEGNKSTQWSPSSQDLASHAEINFVDGKITTAVSQLGNILPGGNIFPNNGKIPNMINYPGNIWAERYNSDIVYYRNTQQGKEILPTPTLLSNTCQGDFVQQVTILTDGQLTSATLSFFYDNTHHDVPCTIEQGKQENSYVVWATYNVPNKKFRLLDFKRIEISGGTYLGFTKPKLEKGTTPTPYDELGKPVSSYDQYVKVEHDIEGIHTSMQDMEGNIHILEETAQGTQETIQNIQGDILNLDKKADGLGITISKNYNETKREIDEINNSIDGGSNNLVPPLEESETLSVISESYNMESETTNANGYNIAKSTSDTFPESEGEIKIVSKKDDSTILLDPEAEYRLKFILNTNVGNRNITILAGNEVFATIDKQENPQNFKELGRGGDKTLISGSEGVEYEISTVFTPSENSSVFPYFTFKLGTGEALSSKGYIAIKNVQVTKGAEDKPYNEETVGIKSQIADVKLESSKLGFSIKELVDTVEGGDFNLIPSYEPTPTMTQERDRFSQTSTTIDGWANFDSSTFTNCGLTNARFSEPNTIELSADKTYTASFLLNTNCDLFGGNNGYLKLKLGEQELLIQSEHIKDSKETTDIFKPGSKCREYKIGITFTEISGSVEYPLINANVGGKLDSSYNAYSHIAFKQFQIVEGPVEKPWGRQEGIKSSLTGVNIEIGKISQRIETIEEEIANNGEEDKYNPNLLKDSMTMSDSTYWQVKGNSDRISLSAGTATITGAWAGMAYKIDKLYQENSSLFSSNAKFTYSFDALLSEDATFSDGGKLMFYADGIFGNAVEVVQLSSLEKGVETRVSVVIEASNLSTKNGIMRVESTVPFTAGNLKIKKIKLEEGEHATSYDPPAINPEFSEIKQELESVKQTVQDHTGSIGQLTTQAQSIKGEVTDNKEKIGKLELKNKEFNVSLTDLKEESDSRLSVLENGFNYKLVKKNEVITAINADESGWKIKGKQLEVDGNFVVKSINAASGEKISIEDNALEIYGRGRTISSSQNRVHMDGEWFKWWNTAYGTPENGQYFYIGQGNSGSNACFTAGVVKNGYGSNYPAFHLRSQGQNNLTVAQGQIALGGNNTFIGNNVSKKVDGAFFSSTQTANGAGGGYLTASTCNNVYIDANTRLQGRADTVDIASSMGDSDDTPKSQLLLDTQGQLLGYNGAKLGLLGQSSGFAVSSSGLSAIDSTQFRIFNSGKKAITFGEKTNTEVLIQISKDKYSNMLPSSSGTTLVLNGSGVICKASSAKKYKRNIHDFTLTDEQVENLLNITPILYSDKEEYEEKGSRAQIFPGFLADDFDNLGLKEVVQYNEFGEVEGLMYDRLAIYMLPLIQKLYTELQELKKKGA